MCVRCPTAWLPAMSQGPATAATSLENAIFKQKSLGAPLKRLESSSVPNLLDLESESEDIVHTPLTRANSLPKSPQKALVRAFELEGSKLLRFREWMACICIGEIIFFYTMHPHKP